MKSKYEKAYEQFVISRICHTIACPGIQTSLLTDFHAHARHYYESLCDMVYLVAIHQADDQDIWLHLNGSPYLANAPHFPGDSCILSWHECSDFLGDLIEPLEHICQRMQTQNVV